MTSLIISESDVQVYTPDECAVFWRTKELYGGFSNMCGGYAIQLGDIVIRSSEALYQACRYPDHPDIQEMIFSEASPLYSKKVAHSHLEKSREDWMTNRVEIMLWCVRVKLACNFQKLGDLYKSTYTLPIVEKTVNRPDFWGAELQPDGTLVGVNALGKVHGFLRSEYLRAPEQMLTVNPPALDNFRILGKPVEPLVIKELPQPAPEQLSLF